MDEIQSDKITIARCRVCSENAIYDLWDTKFRCFDEDILLIEAFNAFSKLKNVKEFAIILYQKYFYEFIGKKMP